jgi:hypothetical protein
LAILIKVFAFFPLVIASSAVVLSSWGIKRAAKDPQVWAVGFVSGLIPVSYYFLAIPRSASTYVSEWVYGFSHLLAQPGFYVRWMTVLDGLVNLPVLFLSLIGVAFFSSRGRSMSLGLWIGYGLLGMSVPSLIQSHTYYNLPLIPILALSLAPLGELVFSQLRKQAKTWQVFFALVALISITYPVILSRNAHVARDYRLEAAAWEKLGEVMPKDGDLIGLTHDYDTRLNYYGWTAVTHWPYVSDLEMQELSGVDHDLNDPAWRTQFEEKTQGYEYFVVTVRGELEAQPVLKSVLYENFEIYAEAEEGEYYIIFDLRKKNP